MVYFSLHLFCLQLLVWFTSQIESENQNEASRFGIEPLHANSYFLWSYELGIPFRGKELWEYVEGTVAESEQTKERKLFQRHNDLALAHTLMSITNSYKASVITLRDPKAVWNKLRDTFQAVSQASIDAML